MRRTRCRRRADCSSRGWVFIVRGLIDFFSVRERDWGEYDERGVTAGVRAAASVRGFSMWGCAIGGVRIAPRDGRRSGHINEEVRIV